MWFKDVWSNYSESDLENEALFQTTWNKGRGEEEGGGEVKKKFGNHLKKFPDFFPATLCSVWQHNVTYLVTCRQCNGRPQSAILFFQLFIFT